MVTPTSRRQVQWPTPMISAMKTETAMRRSHDGPRPSSRAARRERRKTAAEDRRRRHETAERAAALVRSARKQERVGPSAEQSTPAAPEKRSVPALVRQPSLTPAQREEFDPAHALVGAVVYAWVPFDRNTDDDESPEGGKGRSLNPVRTGPATRAT